MGIKKIDFNGVFLLLLYLFASSPLNLFHHHQSQILVPEVIDANFCELAVYYGLEDVDLAHDSHLTEIPIDCLWCDHHLQVDQFLAQWKVEFFIETILSDEIVVLAKESPISPFFQLPNKDPPLI